MSEMRVFGQETTIRLTQNNVPLLTITAIKNFTMETGNRIITENYLGETAARQDEIFDEIKGSMSVDLEGNEILKMQQFIVQRSQNRTSNAQQISASFRINFPNGSSCRITIPDMKFDPIPINVGGRDTYVNVNLTYKASSYLPRF